jgi:hypothetical protein
MGEKRIGREFCWTDLEEDTHLVDPGVNKSIILKRIFKKLDRRV